MHTTGPRGKLALEPPGGLEQEPREQDLELAEAGPGCPRDGTGASPRVAGHALTLGRIAPSCTDRMAPSGRSLGTGPSPNRAVAAKSAMSAPPAALSSLGEVLTPQTVPTSRALAVAALAAMLTFHSSAAGSVAWADRPEVRPQQAHALDRIIVGFAPGATAGSHARVARAAGGSARQLSPLAADAVLIDLPPGLTVAEASRRVGGMTGVTFVEPDFWLEPAATVDDPWYLNGGLWGMYGEATLPHANPFGSGAGAAWEDGHVGTGAVHVGVVDEGIKIDHPDLAANIWTHPTELLNGLDDDGNGYVDDVHGWDFHDDDASVYDGDFDDHGTHVAGTIGARGGNGIGVAGVAWRVTLIPARFLGPSGGYTSDVVRALDYVTDLRRRHGLQVVATNNSWSGGGYSQALADAIDRGGDAGILFVAAAGNGGHDLDEAPVYPASHACITRADGTTRGWDCLISVTNLDVDGSPHPDANVGAVGVDLAAPGTRIVSTHPRGDSYAALTGTSMAAPHVSGALALCAGVRPSLPPERIRALLLETGAPTGSLDGRTVSGRRLDVASLLDACLSEPAPPGPTPSPSEPPGSDPTPPAAVTVSVDDLDPQFRRFGPGWSEADVGLGGHLYWLPAQEVERVAYGSWRPLLPAGGSYLVMARIPAAYATSSRAVYRIKTVDGWVTRVRSQEKRQGTWASLGVHELSTTPIVQLADLTGEPAGSGRTLAYDAVRFIPVTSAAALGQKDDGG